MTKIEEKRQLRRTMRALESGLSARYKAESSRAIAAHLLAMPEYQEAGTVFCFVGTGREIDTRPILEDVLAARKRLCVPQCVGKGIMELRQVTDLRQLIPGAYGILEPEGGTVLEALDETALALVPCLAADRHGRRLGRGGGYYDHFLGHYKGKRLLLCPAALVWDAVPADDWDVRFAPGEILTEKGFL